MPVVRCEAALIVGGDIVRVVLGVDIGGTKIAAAPIARDGRPVADVARTPSDVRDEGQFLAGLCADLLRAADSARSAGLEVAAIGIGCAGTVARHTGTVVTSPNLPLRRVPVARIVGERLGLPVVLDNDANVAAFAEARVGAAAGLRHVVMLTLGTGVGGGLVLGGHVYRGGSGAAGELGHVLVAAGGEPCSCGARGCLEAYASGTALEKTAAHLAESGGVLAQVPGWESISHLAPDLGAAVDVRGLVDLVAGGRLTGETIGVLAASGDPGAGLAVAIVGVWLGVGAANLANIFEPEAIVVGGGLSALGEPLLAPARRVLKAVALAPSRDAPLLMATLGSEAGVVGAGLMAWEEYAGGAVERAGSDV
jgi:glucokinase